MESDDCGGRGGGSGGGGWEECCGGGGRDEEVDDVCGGGGGEVLRALSEKNAMSGLSLASFGIFHYKEGKCSVINKMTVNGNAAEKKWHRSFLRLVPVAQREGVKEGGRWWRRRWRSVVVAVRREVRGEDAAGGGGCCCCGLRGGGRRRRGRGNAPERDPGKVRIWNVPVN